MIQINNLHKYYNKGKKNEQHVLNDITLEFPRTGLVCILGESGSGKTTLLNTVGGLDTFSGDLSPLMIRRSPNMIPKRSNRSEITILIIFSRTITS